MEQNLIITATDNENQKIGHLCIRAVVNQTYTEEDIKLSNITLKNVPIAKEIDNKTPIQLINNQIYFLEETEYDILFNASPKIEDNITDYNIFYTLKSLDREENTFKIMNLRNATEQAALLNFKSYAGKTFIDIKKDNKIIFQLPIEVRSRKIDYNEQYPAMIGDLSEYSSGLIFEMKSSVFQKLELKNKRNNTFYEDFMILEYLFMEENLPATFEYLSRNLYSSLENKVEEVPTSLASNIGPNELIDLITKPKNLEKTNSRLLKGYLPQKVNEIKYIDNIDTPENRFFKNFIEFVDDLINKLLKNVDEGYVKDKLKEYKEETNYFLTQRFFKDISRMDYAPLNSQVLQKKEGYRDILQYFLMFEFGFKMNWNQVTNDFKGYEKKLYELYEYWCYFELIHIVKDLTGSKINFEDVFEINTNEWNIYLKEGQIKEFDLEINETPIKLELMYNKTFDKSSENYNSYSVQMRPDYTLAIKFNEKEYEIHFDAKYKVDFYNENSFKNTDIQKMHAYKDAIANTIGAYVLYPGKKEEIFIKNKFESVGAFPLNPGKNKHERKNITNFIRNLIIDLIKKEREK